MAIVVHYHHHHREMVRLETLTSQARLDVPSEARRCMFDVSVYSTLHGLWALCWGIYLPFLLSVSGVRRGRQTAREEVFPLR